MNLYAKKCESKRRLDGKTVLITGSNAGLGKETALLMFIRGARVLMACRDKDKAALARDEIINKCLDIENVGELIIIQLDLSSISSIKKCGEKILEQEKRLDVLINNAVIICKKTITEDGFDIQFMVNYLGPLLLTFILMPLLKTSKKSRIVNVSSYTHNFANLDLEDLNFENRPYGLFKAYNEAKLMMIMGSFQLSKKLKECQINDVNVYCLHPGLASTGITKNWNEVFPGLNNLLKYTSKIIMSVNMCCQTILYCAIDEKCENESGFYYSNCRKSNANRKARDHILQEKLWRLSCEYLGYFNSNPLLL